MKTNKFLIAAVICSLYFIPEYSQSQNESAKPAGSSTYNTALGLRLGGISGIDGKFMLGSGNAVEGIFSFWDHGFILVGLYEWLRPAGGLQGLNWYYGFGGHVGLWSEPGGRWHYVDGDHSSTYHANSFAYALDGIVGIEYKIPPIPFVISLDMKPFVEFSNHGHFHTAFDPGLGVKFIFD